VYVAVLVDLLMAVATFFCESQLALSILQRGVAMQSASGTYATPELKDQVDSWSGFVVELSNGQVSLIPLPSFSMGSAPVKR